MKRNVILMGNKSHVISLPADWIKKHNIKKGHELCLKQELGKITIFADFKENKKPIKFAFSKEKLIKAYQLGYDEVRLHDCDILEIEGLLPELSGFEIIEYVKDVCIIKAVTEIEKKDFWRMFRRISLIMPQCHTIEKNKSLQRLINICKRSICKQGCGDFCKSLEIYSVLCKFEEIINSKNIKNLKSFIESMELETVIKDSCPLTT